MVDTDYITKESALSCFHDWIDRYGHEHSADEMVEYQRIEELPVADVVEVVRCRDCRYDHACLTQQFVEENSKIPFNRDEFFCPDGKRRESE